MLLDPVAKLLALFDCVQQPSLTALDAVDPSLLETCFAGLSGKMPFSRFSSPLQLLLKKKCR